MRFGSHGNFCWVAVLMLFLAAVGCSSADAVDGGGRLGASALNSGDAANLNGVGHSEGPDAGGTASASIDPNAIRSQYDKREYEKQGAELARVLNELLPELLEIEVLRGPAVLEESSDQVQLAWIIRLSLDADRYYDEYAPKVQRTLESIALRSGSDMSSRTVPPEGERIEQFPDAHLYPAFTNRGGTPPLVEGEYLWLVADSQRNTASVLWKWYVIDARAGQVAIQLNPYYDRVESGLEYPDIVVTFLDTAGRFMREERIELSDPLSGRGEGQPGFLIEGFEMNDWTQYASLISPFTFFTYYLGKPKFYAPAELIPLGFVFSRNEASNLGKIECKLDFHSGD